MGRCFRSSFGHMSIPAALLFLSLFRHVSKKLIVRCEARDTTQKPNTRAFRFVNEGFRRPDTQRRHGSLHYNVSPLWLVMQCATVEGEWVCPKCGAKRKNLSGLRNHARHRCPYKPFEIDEPYNKRGPKPSDPSDPAKATALCMQRVRAARCRDKKNKKRKRDAIGADHPLLVATCLERP